MSDRKADKLNVRQLAAEIRLALQARESLCILEQSNGTANDDLLSGWLSKIGLAVAHRDLAALLDRLEREGFVRTEDVEGRRVVHLTRDGLEIARDVVRCDWIAPPN